MILRREQEERQNSEDEAVDAPLVAAAHRLGLAMRVESR